MLRGGGGAAVTPNGPDFPVDFAAGQRQRWSQRQEGGEQGRHIYFDLVLEASEEYNSSTTELFARKKAQKKTNVYWVNSTQVG